MTSHTIKTFLKNKLGDGDDYISGFLAWVSEPEKVLSELKEDGEHWALVHSLAFVVREDEEHWDKDGIPDAIKSFFNYNRAELIEALETEVS